MKIILSLLLTGMLLNVSYICKATPLQSPPAHSQEELYQDLFLSMLLPYLQHEINAYYRDKTSTPPTVYPYEVTVQKTKRLHGYRSFEFEVTLLVIPMVGAHNPVGRDQFIYRIGAGGNVRLLSYKHLKDR